MIIELISWGRGGERRLAEREIPIQDLIINLESGDLEEVSFRLFSDRNHPVAEVCDMPHTRKNTILTAGSHPDYMRRLAVNRSFSLIQ